MMVTGKFLARSLLPGTLLALLAACSSNPEQSGDPAEASTELPDTLAETSWKVENIYENDADAALATLRFDENDRVGGSAGCNNFSGQVTRTGNSIDFGLLATTRKMCEPAVNGQERAYLEALDAVSEWRRVDSQLELVDEEGRIVLKLEALEPES